MSFTPTCSGPISVDSRSGQSGIDLAIGLFLVSAFLAPWEMSLFGTGFTADDAVMVVVAALVAINRRPLRFLPFRFGAAAYVFLLFALLSAFRASHQVQSLTQILQFVFIFFVQIPTVLTLARSPVVFRMSLLMLLAGTLVGVTWAYLSGEVQGAGRAVTFYSDSADRLGYPIAYTLPLGLFLLLDARGARRLLAIIIAVPVLYLLAWGLAASASRGATLAALIAALVFLAFREGFQINPRVMLRFSLAVGVIGFLAYWLYQSEYLPTVLRDRIDRTLMMEESLTDDRLHLAVAGWRAFLESPLVGVGLDNFKYVAGKYWYQASNQPPHNLWIQLLAQVGVFGALAFLALMLSWFVLLLQAEHQSTERSQRELLWAFLASMIAIMTIYLFLPLMIPRVYWLIYGLGLALSMQQAPVQNVPVVRERPPVFSQGATRFPGQGLPSAPIGISAIGSHSLYVDKE